jgi:hypothetical protein
MAIHSFARRPKARKNEEAPSGFPPAPFERHHNQGWAEVKLADGPDFDA